MYRDVNGYERRNINESLNWFISLNKLNLWKNSNDYKKFENLQYTKKEFYKKMSLIEAVAQNSIEIIIKILDRNFIKIIYQYYQRLDLFNILNTESTQNQCLTNIIELYINTFHITDFLKKFDFNLNDIDFLMFEYLCSKYNINTDLKTSIINITKGFRYYHNIYSEDEFDDKIDSIYDEVPYIDSMDTILYKLTELFNLELKSVYESSFGTESFMKSEFYPYFKDINEPFLDYNDKNSKGYLDDEWWNCSSDGDETLYCLICNSKNEISKNILREYQEDMPVYSENFSQAGETYIDTTSYKYPLYIFADSIISEGLSIRAINLLIISLIQLI